MPKRKARFTLKRVDVTRIVEEVDVASGDTGDRSGTVGAAGVWQLIMSANPQRKYMYIQNQGSDALWYKLGNHNAVPGEPGTYRVGPNFGSYETGSFCPTDAVYVTSPTANIAFSAREA